MGSPSGVGPGVLVCGGVWVVQEWTAAGMSLGKPGHWTKASSECPDLWEPALRRYQDN